MKKLLCLVLALLMLCGAAGAEEALTYLYYDPDLNMTMVLPEGFILLSRNTTEERYASLEMDRDAIVDFMVANNTYAAIFPPDFSYEMDVSMVPNTVDSFNNHTEAELMETLPEVAEALEGAGVTFDRGEFYTNGRDHYLRLFYHVPGDMPTYAVQYYTVQNHQAINFRVFTYGAEATEAQLSEVQALMDNVSFTVSVF